MPCSTCKTANACPLQQVQITSSLPVHAGGMNGIFNINKPAGMTSHDVVAIVRRAARIPRVGHAGTLDPMATGVLLVCVGSATRVVEYLTDHDKRYRARVRLGIETDTYDAMGTIVAQCAVSATCDQVETALKNFVGKIAQQPPAYSAIKRDGVPLYKLARQGIEIETTARDVEIFSIEIASIELPDIEFDVHCSKGTYIRSLAHDLGAKLGCGAHLTALTRTASGQFTLQDSITLDQLRDAIASGFAEPYLHPLDEAVLQFDAIVLDTATVKNIQQGKSFYCGREFATPLLRVYSTEGIFIALLERGDAHDEWKPKKVFLI
jgi:tRNA pseudouridine55 synthase